MLAARLCDASSHLVGGSRRQWTLGVQALARVSILCTRALLISLHNAACASCRRDSGCSEFVRRGAMVRQLCEHLCCGRHSAHLTRKPMLPAKKANATRFMPAAQANESIRCQPVNAWKKLSTGRPSDGSRPSRCAKRHIDWCQQRAWNRLPTEKARQAAQPWQVSAV